MASKLAFLCPAALPDSADKTVRRISISAVLRFTTRYWARRRALFSAGVAMSFVATCFDLALPWASATLVDAIASRREASDVWLAWALFVLMFAGFTIARNLSHRLWIPVAARNMEEITNEAFDRVQRFPVNWHTSSFAGGLVRRISRAMWGYDDVTDALTVHIGPAIVVLAGLSAMLLARSPMAGGVAILCMTLFTVINLLVTARYVRPANQTSTELDAAVSATIADAIVSNTSVKSFAAEDRELRRLALDTARWQASIRRTWARFVDLGLLQNIVLLAMQAGVTGMMVQAWSAGRATPGDVTFAITAFILMSGYLRNLGDSIRALQKGIDDTADAVAFCSMATEAVQVGPPLIAPHGAIRFEGVRFSYGADREAIVDNLDLAIAAGEAIAITGESGSGKSTLIRLLHRLYEIQGGRILIDGQDIAGVSLASLRAAIAVAPQEPVLFHRSIRENIGYGRPDAPMEDIRRVARLACADQFIERLPGSYDCVVGERGATLSGGERQRIALARALLVEAPILVLDEATSALDRETEAQVLRNLEAMRPRTTRIVIAHRPAPIASAGRVVRLAGGKATSGAPP